MMSTESMTPCKWAFRLTNLLNGIYSTGDERFPVDVKKLAKEYSYQVYPKEPITMIKGASLPNFDGALYKSPPGKCGWGIIYNDLIKSKGRINYTLAHEFGHYLLHRVKYPNGIECGEQDLIRWDSDYAQIEYEANEFAANLLMPLDDYREQIKETCKIDFDMISHCADRYGVSFIAAILRWLEYTRCCAVLVVSRDGFILWSRSSKLAYKSGMYFKVANRPPIPVPQNSLAITGGFTQENIFLSTKLSSGIWFNQPCQEMVIFSELYDFTISIIQFEI